MTEPIETIKPDRISPKDRKYFVIGAFVAAFAVIGIIASTSFLLMRV